ncbi:unnamed protein product [Arctia plantaginis]|uniref:omega-amidase n=1 Tax=Arctia plantaginis TaxID=874455 RepID=A0A8S1ACB6_ARCPL|nr:unnamed protein product [Arctia plantaginis]CAB3253917.1 unnamed protein product [Arctia plantaginis]
MIRALKVALVQMSVGFDKKKNIQVAVNAIYEAKKNGAQLVALPECFNSPYGTKYFDEYSERVPAGETCAALSKAAADTGMCVVGGTMPEKCDSRLYNTCTVWDPKGTMIASHRKAHLFDIDIPGKITFRESESLSAGNKITTFSYCGVKIGIGICYDIRFVEMATLMAKEGCSFLIYPAAFNMTTGPKHWELLGRARANDLQLYVALVSPARDPKADYVAWGHTMLIDPWAKVEASLDEKPGLLYGTIDTKVVQDVRSQIPIRMQRRTDMYETVNKTKS